MASTHVDVEHYPQNGTKDHAGSAPEHVRVYCRDATGTVFVTHLSRWDDDPLTVDKRVKKTGREGDRRTRTVTPKVTPTVREELEQRGFTVR